jgi:hypothetical protein
MNLLKIHSNKVILYFTDPSRKLTPIELKIENMSIPIDMLHFILHYFNSFGHILGYVLIQKFTIFMFKAA